jgi:hypothetical protein
MLIVYFILLSDDVVPNSYGIAFPVQLAVVMNNYLHGAATRAEDPGGSHIKLWRLPIKWQIKFGLGL